MPYCSYSKTDDICPKTPHQVETMGQRKNRMSPKIGNGNCLTHSDKGGLLGKADKLRLTVACPPKRQPMQADSPQVSRCTEAKAQDESEKMRVLGERYHRTKSGSCWVWSGR